MKEKLQNLPFVVKVILSFLITILSFISIFLAIMYFDLLIIFSVISVIITITLFTAIIYYTIFKD